MREDRPTAEAPEIHRLSEADITGQQLTGSEGKLAERYSPLSLRSVYYRYNAYTIDRAYERVVEAHAKFLREHQDVQLRIEGNCDERGSTEYNLALGQRRADFVKRGLVLLGAGAKQVSAVSLGSQKPKALGVSGAARAQNRRSDLVYVGAKASR